MDRANAVKWILIGLFGLAGLRCVAQPVRAGTLPDCWDVAYGAIHHRAEAPHPPFIIYSERMLIAGDGRPLLQNRENVIYRDDGLARISDDRFDGHAYLTNLTDPGPPELGPYGNRRSMWLPIQESDYSKLPLIGEVRSRNPSGLSCTNDGIERYKDHDTYLLSFTTQFPERPSLKALWVDVHTSEIWKVILTGYLPIALTDNPKNARLTDFEVELQEEGRYLVVNHVTWKYRYHQYDQYSNLFGEYYYTGFQFPSDLPSTAFRT